MAYLIILSKDYSMLGGGQSCESLARESLISVTPLLNELHCLPVRQRIVFKILLYTFN